MTARYKSIFKMFFKMNSSDPKDYWYRIKKRENVSVFELSTICRQLKLLSNDGKNMLLIVLPSRDC